MGLTERHWFEDEEPELTEDQLEDRLWENNKIFERGYQKGFSDGRSADQEPVVPFLNENHLYVSDMWKCGACEQRIFYRQRYCSNCGRAVKW